MNDSSTQDALEDLLERERTALLAGDLESIIRLSDEKERLVSALAPFEKDDLESLQAKAMRNQQLLNSAIEGIRAVSNRLATLRDTRDRLNTYDKTGRRQTIEGTFPRKLEKRA